MLKFVNRNPQQAGFIKYETVGEDFILASHNLDLWKRFVLDAEDVSRLLHRRFGIGASGLLLIEKVENYGFKLTKYNNDGQKSEEFCPNAARCAVAYAVKHGVIPMEFKYDGDDVNLVRFLDVDGPHIAIYHEDNGRNKVSLRMNNVKRLNQLDEYNFNIHAGALYHVRRVQNLQDYDVTHHGGLILTSRRYTEWQPMVVAFSELRNEQLFLRCYDRFSGTEIVSSGGAAVASVLAELASTPWQTYTPWDQNTAEQNGSSGGGSWSALEKHAAEAVEETVVHMPGGTVKVTCERVGAHSFKNLYLTGPTNEVFKGTTCLPEDTSC